MNRADEIESALRSALMTMSLAAGILEKNGDEHGVAWNLRNEIAQGNQALKTEKMFGFDIVIDPTLPDGMAEIKDGYKLLARIVGIAPNGEVRGASVTAQPACEASSGEAATSTVVLDGDNERT